MDLTNYYRDFVVDDGEFSFHCVRGTVPSYLDEDGNLHCAVATFQRPDTDLAHDPLSTNHRFTADTPLAMFSSLIVAGSSRDHIKVLIPDTVSTMVNDDSPLGLQHVVGLQLGTPADLGSSLPATGLDRVVCDNSVTPCLIRKRGAYPILDRWQSVNDTKCPECDQLVTMNMARHLRLEHTFYQCVWRCPVANCPSWFTSESDGKDHLESTHMFSEGNGYSAYESLRHHGLEWYGRRTFFDLSRTSAQELWMDIALARKSGQRLHNEYVITESPAYNNLRLFFHAAVRELVNAYYAFPRDGRDYTAFAFVPRGSLRRHGINPAGRVCPPRHNTGQDNVHDILESDSFMDTLSLSPTIPICPVVMTPDVLQSPVERMTDLISSGSEHSQLDTPISRGSVYDVSLASTNLLTHVEPLPLSQLICHSAATVRSWPDTHRNDVLAVTYRDMAVVRRNMADCYLDVHAMHIAACYGALDNNLPLMSADITPRVTGGIRSALIAADQNSEDTSTGQD